MSEGERIIIRRSFEFSVGTGKARSYLVKDVPAGFWRRVEWKARRERRSIRAVILTLLKEWVNGVADSEAGSPVCQVQRADDLQPGQTEEAQGGQDYGQEGSALSAGVDRPVAAEVGQHPDSGVG